MTKTKRNAIVKAALKEGYDKYREGIISSQDWNNWSHTCYQFQDEEITFEQLEDKLDDI